MNDLAPFEKLAATILNDASVLQRHFGRTQTVVVLQKVGRALRALVRKAQKKTP